MLNRLRFNWQLLPLLILVSGLLAWAAAYVLAPDPYQQISQRLDLKSTEIIQLLDRVEDRLVINSEDPFSNLPKEQAYSYYIFQDEQPIFWSDYHLLPAYNLLKSTRSVQYLSLNEGQFLSFQKVVEIKGAQYVLFALLPLQHAMFETAPGQRFNPEVFSSSSFALSNTDAAGFKPIYLLGHKEPVFFVSVTEGYPKGISVVKELAAWSVLSGLLGLAVVAWYRARKATIRQKSLWVYLGGLFIIRLLMLVFDLPYRIYPLRVFNPQHYASSNINPSLADFLLNALLLLGVVLLLWTNRHYLLHRLVKLAGVRPVRILAVCLVVLLMVGHFYCMKLLFFHAQFSLDITKNIDVSVLKILAWSIVGLLAVAFFLLTHPLLVWLRAHQFSKQELIIFTAVIVLALLVLLWQFVHWFLLLLALLFYSLLYSLLTPRAPAPKLNYSLFIYLFGAAIVCALSAALALHTQHKTNRKAEKERLATQVLTERDLIGEYLLHETAQLIENDPYIINRFLSPLFSKEGIEQKIRRQYLSRYFDKYETSVRLFGLDGNPLSGQFTGTYATLKQQAEQEGEPTESKYLLRLPGDGAGNYHYKQFIPVNYQQSNLGYVMLDLKLKRYQPRTVYPELFLGQQFNENVFERNNYAVFANGKIRFDAGEFDYLHLFQQDLLQEEALYRDGIFTEGYHHLAVKGENNRLVVVSSPEHPVSFIYANFSFILLLLLFFITLYILGYLLFRRLSVRYLNFTTKIQLYLNFAIFAPLLIITVSTLSFISQSYRKETEQQFFETAESISRGMSDLLREYQQGYIDKEALNSSLDRIARYTETDIHLFDTRGMLQATSQPAIYQKNYLAPVINPHAQAEIVEQRHRQTILTETVGKLQYRSAYVAVRNNSNGELLGIISVPFFDAGYVLQRQLSAIFSNIVSIFATLFIIFLLLLYLFSKELTAPLRYIADRLRLISLTGKNEPLSWPTEDEIGLLVREYNLMLLNLQASKEALSRTEKESAWREMAKQVAHEIKNPLTPMRLSLQHLNRRLQDVLEEQQKDKVNRSFESILEQIDTLSDIATSFSAFAKMPAPRQETFDVATVLHNVVRLYTSEQHHQLEVQIPEGRYMVQGDEQMMQRTFNNLILNGIQAVPTHRQPCLTVMLEQQDGKVLIKIKDNGTGIPETIRNKVFVPNFSTKNSGSGLGLAIAKRGIEHAGGQIWFESNSDEMPADSRSPEEGTTFFIELPLVE